MNKQFEGDVDHWNQTFGFIKYKGTRIFFSAHGVEPDWKGSRAWAFARGIPVKFAITQRVVSGASKDCATNVEPLFPMSEPEDLHSYRETSEVINLNRRKGFAFLIRPCGDSLFLHKNDVAPGYETRWDLLEVGSPVYHGVQVDGFSGRWMAANAELYSYDELQRFKNEGQEPEPVTVIAPQVAAPALTRDSVLAPHRCNKTLLQLIQDRRTKS